MTLAEVQEIGRQVSTVGERVVELNDRCQEFDKFVRELNQRQEFMIKQVTDALSTQNGTFQLLRDEVRSE